MGLISEEIEIKWSSRIKNYYENLGYIFTKVGDYFIIKINDLQNGSNEKINVRCDGCGKLYPIKFITYNRYVHSDGEYYCHKCSQNENKKWISFAEWGIGKFGNDFLDKYWDYELNEIDPYDITKCSNGYAYIKCQEKEYHGSYKTKVNRFYNGGRCGYCHSDTVHKMDSLGYLFSEVLEIWSNENKNKSPYEYALKSHEEVYWKCENGVHDDYKRRISSSVEYAFRCPSCTQERRESFLQEKVRLYLESFNFHVYHEKDCSLNPKNIVMHKKIKSERILRYDNEIVFNNNIRLFIEVHGHQHYEIDLFHKMQSVKYGTTPKYEFEYGKKKDAYKKQYVLDNRFDYLEIPYWLDDDNETWKKLIDDKIRKILK